MPLQIVVLRDEGMIHPTGHSCFEVPNIHTLFVSLSDIITQLGKDNRVNVYYTLAHHTGLRGPKPSRSQATFDYQTVLPFDIDNADTAQALNYLAPVAQILGTEPANLILTVSGYGLQVLANLKNPIRSTKYLSELKPAYNELVHKLQRALMKEGLPGKVDPVVFDAARVFRLPNTINRKPGRPDAESRLIQYSPAQLDIDIMEVSGIAALIKENISPLQVRRNYPQPDFCEMTKECRFIQWAITKPEEVHEPQAFDLFSLLSVQPPGAKVDFQGKELSPVELAEHVFDNAKASPSLARGEFRDKWEGASRYGARKCSTIASNWIGGCETCPHHGKIPTPLALRSDSHIGSAEMGYWVVTPKGIQSHPNYGDLAKVYAKENSFVATRKEMVYSFEKGHYVESPQPFIKAWVDKKMVPSEPLRNHHCTEFVQKILRTGMLSVSAEDHLFNKSIVGKLNCQNGVLDILTGELLPHSAQFGFRYILPYDYVPDAESPLFLSWLNTITQSRPDLIESILDIMAYVLWPSYDDHMFAYFIGEGSNGKSTLIRVMQAMIGRDNFSAVSLQQLGSNRFAPAQLEGKLANICEESSGYEMNIEEMNVIKNLSAGGEMMAERKGAEGFTFQNKAKLIFSANKPPKFREDGVAVQRRMIALPFDYAITRPDDRVAKQLLEEVPSIVSMLVRRIQANVKHNGGVFVVFRGGVAAAETQKKLLMGSNNVVEWANERVESVNDPSAEAYIGVTDAFLDYNRWCSLNNHRAMSNVHFSRGMYQYVIPKGVDPSKNVVRVNEKVKRVFKMMKWKEIE